MFQKFLTNDSNHSPLKYLQQSNINLVVWSWLNFESEIQLQKSCNRSFICNVSYDIFQDRAYIDFHRSFVLCITVQEYYCPPFSSFLLSLLIILHRFFFNRTYFKDLNNEILEFWRSKSLTNRYETFYDWTIFLSHKISTFRIFNSYR